MRSVTISTSFVSVPWSMKILNSKSIRFLILIMTISKTKQVKGANSQLSLEYVACVV
jgi:hypothetical protein